MKTELVRVMFCDGETGHPIDEHGEWALRGSKNAQSEYWKTFPNRNDANGIISDYLRQFPYAECWIEEMETGKQEWIVGESYSKYFAEKKLWESWISMNPIIKLFKKCPTFEVFRTDRFEER